jgi:AAA domain
MGTGFPRELLARPARERVQYFKEYIVAHPVLKEARVRLLQIIREPADGLLVFVLGPSGVGKTTLRCKFQEKIVEGAGTRMEADPGHIPVVGVEAVSSDTGKFVWKDFYRRALAAVDETMLDHKVAYGVRYEDTASRRMFSYKSTATEHRQAYEQVLRHRRPLAVCIDEAQHIAKGASGSSLLSQMDCLKSLANLTETPHVLFGTYALRVFRNLSGQLIRRSVDVHLRRYRASTSDLKVFKGVVKTFQHELPVHEIPDLEAQWEFLYERSLGCVGTLKEWLCRALSVALEEDGGRALRHEHLSRTAIPVSQCEQMLNEIIEGEVALKEDDRSVGRLRTLLKFDGGMREETTAANHVAAEDGRRSRNQKRVRVGARRPKRDPVGHQEHAG